MYKMVKIINYILRITVVLGLFAPLSAYDCYIVIQNQSGAPWTLKVTSGLNEQNGIGTVTVGVVDLDTARRQPSRVENGQARLGYWDLEKGHRYCMVLSAKEPVTYEFGLGGSNRNYRIFTVGPTESHKEDNLMEIKASSYQIFLTNPMIPMESHEVDPVVIMEGKAVISIKGSNYPTEGEGA
jgi:hypothetical protein